MQLPISLREVMRSLRRSPLFAAMATVSLGLALALNTTTFALADAVLHPVVPLDRPEELYWVRIRGGASRQPPGFLERVGELSVAALGGKAQLTSYVLSVQSIETGTTSEVTGAVAVEPAFFTLLGVIPEVGRAFSADDADGAVVSRAFWLTRLGGRPLSEGLTLTAGGRTYPVIGVMPRGMHEPGNTAVWLPRGSLAGNGRGSSSATFGPFPVIRVNAGETKQTMQSALNVVAARLTTEYSTRDHPYAVGGYSVIERPRSLEPLYYVLGGAVCIVLLIACANLGTLMLARGMARRREVALRMALGASRWRIMQLVFAECGVLAAAGASVGALLTMWTLELLSTRGARVVAELGDIAPVPSWRVFAFVFVVAVATMLLSGLLPALRAATIQPATLLKDGASGTTTGRTRDHHNPLVVAQIALSMALLMGAVLLVRSAETLGSYAFQYDARHLVSASLDLKPRRVADAESVERTYDAVIARASALPGVAAAATRSFEMPDGRMIVAEAGRGGEQWLNLSAYAVVSPDFLRTFGIPIVRGRDFSAGDRAAGDGVAIVDEEAARRLWPTVADPVGHMLKLGGFESKRGWLRVIGVARSVEMMPRRVWDLPPEPAIYVVYPSDASRTRTLFVRSTSDGPMLPVALRRTIEATLPGDGWVRVEPLLRSHDRRVEVTSFLASLFAAFGAFALALSGVGLYGVLAYGVTRRLPELAVRVALGASPGAIARLVLRQGAVLTLGGIGAGAFVALAATRALGESMWPSRYGDVIALVIAELVIAAVAVAAAAGPARRAARTDPAEVLRAA